MSEARATGGSTAVKYAHRAHERVGRWELIAPLGKGGFSEVWHARHAIPCEPLAGMGPGMPVALKLLVHPEHVVELRKEASALAIVRGEGIVRTFETDLEHEPPFIALALLEGGDLRARLRESEGKLGCSEALRLVERLLEILGRVHREGVVHGDLKPENVLFTLHGAASGSWAEPFLADFGLSRRIAQRSATLSVSLSLADARLAGTIEYMAPEQREGAKPTPRCDVYALGVILHELVTGERPQGVFDLPGKKDPGLPPLVDRTLAGALALDPRERFADAGAMLKFLRVGLWNDGQLLRASQAGVRDRGVIAGDYAWAWLGTVGFLAAISQNELRKSGAHALAFLAALLVASLPIAVVLPALRRWNARLRRDGDRIERQIEVLRGWREPDAAKTIESIAPEVVRRAKRRTTFRWLLSMLRIALWRRRRRRRLRARVEPS